MANIYQTGGMTGRRDVSFRPAEKIAGQIKGSIIDRLGDVISDVQEDEASYQKIKGWTKPLIDAAIFSAMKLNPATGVFSTLLQVGGKAAITRATDAIYDAIGRNVFGAGAKIEDIKLIGDKYGFSTSALKEMTEDVEEVIKGKESEKWVSALSSAALHQSGEGIFNKLFSKTQGVGPGGPYETFIPKGTESTLSEGLQTSPSILPGAPSVDTAPTLSEMVGPGHETARKNILEGLTSSPSILPAKPSTLMPTTPYSSLGQESFYINPETGAGSQITQARTWMDLIRKIKGIE
jgi:hypothetical protein